MISPPIIPGVNRQTLSLAETDTTDEEQTDGSYRIVETKNIVETKKTTNGSHYMPVVTLQSFVATSNDFKAIPQTDNEILVALDNVLTDDAVVDDAEFFASTSSAELDSLFSQPLGIETPNVDYTNGIQLDEVEDLVRFSEIRLGWNLWFYQYQEVTLLMKDGRGYTGLAQSLQSLNALDSQNESPHLWFNWRTNDSGVRERLNETNNQWVAIRGYSILDRSTQSKTIEADVANTQHSGLWNMGGFTRTTGYRFHASGHFELYMSLMSQYQQDTGSPNIAINKDSRSSELTASQSVPVGHLEVGAVLVNEQQQVNDSMYGTYHIRGNTMVLVFANGTTRSELFADCHGGGLLIGNKLYV